MERIPEMRGEFLVPPAPGDAYTGGSSEPSLARKLFIEANAFSIVPAGRPSDATSCSIEVAPGV